MQRKDSVWQTLKNLRNIIVWSLLAVFLSLLLPPKASAITPIEQLFPDPVLAQAVAEQFDREISDRISDAELEKIKTLVIHDPSFRYWKGIERLKFLEVLDLSGSQIEGNVEDLAKLRRLRVLNLSQTSVQGDFEKIFNLQNLKELNLADTFITGELFDLSSFTQLKTLDLSTPGIAGELACFKRARSLISLRLMGNHITGDLVDLQYLDHLEDLYLVDVNVGGELKNLARLTKLKNLHITGQGAITGSMVDLQGFSDLSTVHLTGTGVTGKLAQLNDFPRLTSLTLVYANITGDLADLQNLRKLTHLNLSDTFVAGNLGDLRALPQLRSLNLNRTSVTGRAEDVHTLSFLQNLEIEETQITGDLISLRLQSAEQARRESELSCIVNGQLILLDPAPKIQDNRVLVPVRGVFEALDARVLWQPETREVHVEKGDIQIVLLVQGAEAYVNGLPYGLEAPAQLDQGRVFVPLRFITEALEAEVKWIEESRTVTITLPLDEEAESNNSKT